MMKYDVYLYGMILITNSFLLKGSYPEADTYGEIDKKYCLPGGETGTCATVLASLGCNVVMDGTYMGNHTYPQMIEFYKGKTVDTSRLFLDQSFDGLEDYVLIDQTTRTPFGSFASYYTDGLHRWNEPLETDILNAQVVGIDPWFQEKTDKVVQICREHKVPYVTIDCSYDSDCHRYSAINILSNEFLAPSYKEYDRKALFEKYTDNTDGLVIFTLGSKEIMYGRKGNKPQLFTPYSVSVVSTLGAGDSFKAGCVYALLHHMEDTSVIRFAAATAACACTVFPLPLNPPTLDNINSFITEQ
ncbi:MAG TPA: PfkB family carbohydrate kinase [Mobilitalea sp.]|nr:PfkB family carbohydrate kinase [Mobilitalea sp.]